MAQLSLPPNQIFQVAYIVPELDVAIQHFSRELNIGAWVRFENLQFDYLQYRGRPSAMTSRVAMGCTGGIMYELIQQLDELPSIYRDTVAVSGYGFHHFGKLVPSLDAAVTDYKARGYDLAMELGTSSGVKVGFVDTRNVLPGMMELVEMSEAVMGFIRMPFASACELGSKQQPIIERH
jgi:hypothetical protein